MQSGGDEAVAPFLDDARGDGGGGREHGPGIEFAEDGALAVGRSGGVKAGGGLVFEEGGNVAVKTGGGVEVGVGQKVTGALDRQRLVVGFEGDEDAAVVALVGEPKSIAAAVETFYSECLVGRR